jgi:hypothetical protein
MMGQLERRAEAISGKFQLAECWKHVVSVCDNGDMAGAADDGAA